MRHAIHRYAKVNNKYMKDQNHRSSCTRMSAIFQQSQNVHTDGSEWKKYKFDFYKDFIRSYDENSGKGYIL